MKKILFSIIFLCGLFPNLENGGINFINVHRCFAQSDLGGVEVCSTTTEDITTEINFGEEVVITTKCYVKVDCETGEEVEERHNCETTEEVRNPCSQYGPESTMADCGCIGGTSGRASCDEGDDGGDGGNGPGGSGPGNPPDPGQWKDCTGLTLGTAYVDMCGECVGGSTGKYPQVWYLDVDSDGWGGSITKICFDPGPGYSDQTGDYNDHCFDVSNSPNQCCDPVSQQAGASATNLLAKQAFQDRLGDLDPTIGTNNFHEQGFSISYNNNNYSATPVQNLGATGGTINYNQYSIADMHTHNLNPPSAQDIMQMITVLNNQATYTTRYVRLLDGTTYALTITDPVAYTAFVSNHPNSVAPNNDFYPLSPLGVKFGEVFLFYNGTREAYERAIAYALTGSGLTLLKAAPGITTLSKIGADVKRDSAGNVILDGNGNKLFEKIDCP